MLEDYGVLRSREGMYSDADRCVIGVDSLFKEFSAVTSFSPLFLFGLFFPSFFFFFFYFSFIFIFGSFVTAKYQSIPTAVNYVLLLLK